MDECEGEVGCVVGEMSGAVGKPEDEVGEEVGDFEGG